MQHFVNLNIGNYCRRFIPSYIVRRQSASTTHYTHFNQNCRNERDIVREKTYEIAINVILFGSTVRLRTSVGSIRIVQVGWWSVVVLTIWSMMIADVCMCIVQTDTLCRLCNVQCELIHSFSLNDENHFNEESLNDDPWYFYTLNRGLYTIIL